MSEEEQKKANSADQDIPIKGRFDKYRSSYWAASVAVLPLVRKLTRPFVRNLWENKEASFMGKHGYSGVAGLAMYAVTAFYAKRTWDDMKTVFSEALAEEFNKEPKDVTYKDFLKSENTMIRQTVDNYMQYNLRRFGVNTTFFLPFLMKPIFQKYNAHPETGVDLGVAANAAYLFTDVLTRKITPFEEIQELIDQKINHSDSFIARITGSDLLDIYERHAKDGKIHSFLPLKTSNKWQEGMEVFDRMAELLNQTYGNEAAKEHAGFQLSEFIYLVGHGLIDPHHIEESRAYIEIANRNGIHEVKQAEIALKNHVPLERVIEKYSVNLDGAQGQEASSGFADKVGTKRSAAKAVPAASVTHREDQRRLEQHDASAHGFAM